MARYRIVGRSYDGRPLRRGPDGVVELPRDTVQRLLDSGQEAQALRVAIANADNKGGKKLFRDASEAAYDNRFGEGATLLHINPRKSFKNLMAARAIARLGDLPRRRTDTVDSMVLQIPGIDGIVQTLPGTKRYRKALGGARRR